MQLTAAAGVIPTLVFSMKRIIVESIPIFFFNLWIPVIPLASEFETVPLPELQGYYSVFDTYTRYASFQLNRTPTQVYNVWIRISGSTNVGVYYCDLYGGPSDGPYPYPVEFASNIRDTVSGHSWMADQIAPDETGDFELTMQFHRIHGWPATWDFLKSGYGTIRSDGSTIMLVAICWPTIFPDATVTDAVLTVEADFQVPVDQSTWGSIKSLLR